MVEVHDICNKNSKTLALSVTMLRYQSQYQLFIMDEPSENALVSKGTPSLCLPLAFSVNPNYAFVEAIDWRGNIYK